MRKYIVSVLLITFVISALAQKNNQQNFHTYAATPPLGWNSWDIYGTTVTEQQIKECDNRYWAFAVPVEGKE